MYPELRSTEASSSSETTGMAPEALRGLAVAAWEIGQIPAGTAGADAEYVFVSETQPHASPADQGMLPKYKVMAIRRAGLVELKNERDWTDVMNEVPHEVWADGRIRVVVEIEH